MSQKPKIEIGEPYIVGGVTICVPYKFDNGVEGVLNFPVGATEEEIERQLKQWYKQCTRPNPDFAKLKGRKIMEV